MLKRIKAWGALAAVLLLAPSSALAFSFGTFAPGETITQIELSAAAGDSLTFDATTDLITLNVSVSQIVTNLNLYTPAAGDVIFSVVAHLTPGSLGIFTTGGVIDQIFADFDGGVVYWDVTLSDLGPGGVGPLLDGDLVGNASFNAVENFNLKSGSFTGDFGVATGDATFMAAWGIGGSFLINLTQFGPLVGPAFADLCQMTTFGTCAIPAPPNDLVTFKAQPNGQITPVVPEPSTGLLVGLGLLAITAVGRKKLR
jgi:hypothetical protein